MAISNFIPTIWSETLYSELDKQYIAAANSNRDFEGEIKEKGSKVRICGVGDILVSNYTKDTDMGTPQTLSDNARELTIDFAKYFNFQIDDIDKAQTTPKLMEAAMKRAASALANEADKAIYNETINAASTINVNVTVDNIIDSIVSARTKLYENNVSSDTEVFLEVSPQIAALLYKAKSAFLSDNTQMVESGFIGNIFGCKVFVSNNIQDIEMPSGRMHRCLMRTKRAIAFAEQLSEIEAYRPEKRFADAIKGLYLFGAKAVFPKEMVALEFTVE